MATRSESAEPQTLAQAIRAARKEHGWSVPKFARLLETQEKNVRNWESGRNQPSHVLYARMCLLFGWPLPYSSDRATGRKRGRLDRPTPEQTLDLALA
jgi:ribosome-binding protein aMBF1 (putative translation factor)